MTMRHFHQKSASHALDYYHAEPGELGNYYGKEVGVFFGKGAALLGLTTDKPVDEATFEMLVNNINPVTKKRLTQRNHAERRVLTDLTLGDPKSVTLAEELLGDSRIKAARLEAGLETMAAAEQDAQTRINKRRGEMTLEKTRNWVGIAFQHRTSRPVNGEPDPHGHTHFCIINATHCGKGHWQAIDLSSVIKDKKFYNSLYMNKLATKIQELGYTIERSEHNFEITGISDRALIEKFSRRTTQIESKAKELGITSKAAKDALGAKTRDQKLENKELPKNLQELWRSRLTSEQVKQLEAARPQAESTIPKGHQAEAAVDWAIEHKFTTSTCIRRRELAAEALLYGIGTATAEQIDQEIDSRNWISKFEGAKQEITTPEKLAEERQAVAYVRNGKGKLKPIAPNHQITRDFLSGEQRAAIHGLLSSQDKVNVVRGLAGVGKTTLMSEVVDAIHGQDIPVAIIAPSSDTAHGTLRDKEGFDAETVSHFLLSKKAQQQTRGGVIYVDEAGMVSMRQMTQLFDVAESINARIFLAGDRFQHASVEYGEPLRLIETQAGCTPFEIKTIRRQKPAYYLEVATLMSQGGASVGKAIDRLDAEGKIFEIAGEEERAKQVASDYADAIAKKESTLVVVPANSERAVTNNAIRAELKDRGVIDGNDHNLTTLKSRRMDNAQKKDPIRYTPGEDVIEFHRHGGGIWKSGTRVTVAEVKGGQVLADIGGLHVAVPLAAAGSFDVFRKEVKPFAAGDTIRFTKNRKPTEGENSKRLHNGGVATIEGFTKDGRLQLSNKQIISPDWQHIEYGYAVTSYKSQSKTYANLIINSGESSFPASSKKQAYVSSTRGVMDIRWYTSDIDDLKSAVNRDRTKRLATELAALPESTPAEPHRSRSIRERAIEFAKKQFERLQRWRQNQRQLEPQHAR